LLAGEAAKARMQHHLRLGGRALRRTDTPKVKKSGVRRAWRVPGVDSPPGENVHSKMAFEPKAPSSPLKIFPPKDSTCGVAGANRVPGISPSSEAPAEAMAPVTTLDFRRRCATRSMPAERSLPHVSGATATAWTSESSMVPSASIWTSQREPVVPQVSRPVSAQKSQRLGERPLRPARSPLKSRRQVCPA